MDATKPTYLYVYSHTSIDGQCRCKVGISANHKNRHFGHYGFGPFTFRAQYSMPTRNHAIALETLVCRTFPAFSKREFLDVTVDEACTFVESQMRSMAQL